MWSKAAEEALSALRLLPDNFATLAVTASETATIKRDKRATHRQRIRDTVHVPNAAELLARATKILESASIYDSYTRLVCGLELVSGRRNAELLNGKSSFTKVDDRMVVFYGQLKTAPGQARSYTIPLLCKTDTFLNAFAILRQKQGDVSGLTDKEVHARYGSNFTVPLIHRIFPGVPKSHGFRGMYARYVEICFKHEPDPAYNYLCCQLLGHAKIQESLNYVWVKLDDIDAIRHTFGKLCLDDYE